ncbi:MAG: hypothetical protein WC838_00250 [Candidatus Margulisiibacteriota bacterium]|jgi:hypothetical protein
MNKEKGFVLIMIMFLLLFMATIGLNTMIIFRSSTIQQSADTVDATASYSSLQAGVNWAVREFYRTDNWPALGISLNNMTVTINNDCNFILGTTASARIATVNITGNFHTLSGVYLKRTAQVVLNRTSPGSGLKFALFVPSPNLITIQNSTLIEGDAYLAGGIVLNSGSTVNSGHTVYFDAGRSASGTGYYYAEPLRRPYINTVPTIDVVKYTALAQVYDGLANGSATDLFWSGIHTLAGDQLGRALTINGNCTINGTGRILLRRGFTCSMNYSLAIIPDPGATILIRSQSCVILSTSSPNRIWIERSTLYANRVYGTAPYIMSIGPNTTVTGCVLIPSNNLNPFIIRDGGKVLNSTVFAKKRLLLNQRYFILQNGVNNPSSFSGSAYVIDGGAAISGNANVPVDFSGLLYTNSTDVGGGLTISTANVTGCIFANQINDISGINRMANSHFVYGVNNFAEAVPTNLVKYVYGVTGNYKVRMR